jgi:serine/threonine protein kinase
MIGEVIGQYRFLEKLGEGGMGVVYLAEDIRLGRRVAIKVLPPALARDPERRERLRREARAAAGLSHAGIATVFALEERDDQLLLVSEYVSGSTLAAERVLGPLALDRVVETALAIADALGLAHARGVVHRDLKPENIIRTPDGGIKILDFGLAQVAEDVARDPTQSNLTSAGAVAGTVAYMSPEQLRGEPVDLRTDIFSLGVVLYELATGVHPFQGPTPPSTIARIQTVEPAPLTEHRSGTAADFGRLIMKCLAKDRDARYQGTGDLVADLERLRRSWRGDTGTAPKTVKASNAQPETARQWWQIHHVVVAAIVVAMIGPLWSIRNWLPGAWGEALFFGFLGCAVLSVTLRGHLLFTSRVNRRSLPAELRQTSPWLQWVDRAAAFQLLAGAAGIAVQHTWWAALLLSVAIGTLVASAVIEPATTRAAFGRQMRPASRANPGSSPRSRRE